MNNVRLRFHCIPPKDSGVEEKIYDRKIMPDGELPGETPDDMLQRVKGLKKEVDDFQIYFDALPNGSRITMSVIDPDNRLLGSIQRIVSKPETSS
jgi:hypothetical protein